MQTDALIEGMNALGYQVVNLSQRELQHGYEAFEARRKKGQFELVSANIVWQDTGEPVVAPTTVRKVVLREGARVHEVRFGFIGLTRNDPAFLKEGPGGRRIVSIDPFSAAEKQAAALRQKADVIVALVNLSLNEMRLLPKRAKEIDLVLGGNGAEQTRNDDFPEDTQIGKARIFAVADQGKMLGEVRLFFNPQRGIASTQRNIIALSREWPGDPALEKLAETTKLAVNEYNKAQTEALSPFATSSPAPPPRSAKAPQEAGSSAPSPQAPEAAAPEVSYTGSERCAPCHAEEVAVWKRSGHARAFAALEKARQDYNPQCVGCHTIGYGKARGFLNAKATPQLASVGCESCHGPSSRHPEGQGRGYGGTDTGFCVTCHTKENSPDFDPASYIPKIRHWTEAKASR